ncbi:MAG TPA: hypothetical protein VH500_23935 [Nitrososphaeraceae archaeon]
MVTGIAKHYRVHEKLKILVTANKMLAAVALNPSLYQEVLWRLVIVVRCRYQSQASTNLCYSN